MMAQKINQFNANGERDGAWRKMYKNGRLRYSGNFENGKEVGTFMYFNMTSSDHPTIIKIFSKTTNIADVEFFTSKGKLRSKGKMEGKNRIGKWQYFFPNGKVLSEESYTNGKLEGLLVNYYPNGKTTEETYYKNGVKNGSSKKYTDDGILIEEVNFVNNKHNGFAKYFDLKGNLKETGEYKEGKRAGKWEFYLDGEVVSDKKKRKTHAIPKQ